MGSSLHVPIAAATAATTATSTTTTPTNNMNKLVLLCLLGLACVSAMSVNNVQDNFSHVQEIDDDGDEITGTYKWTDPAGNQLYVTYVADNHGYRVVDSNVVPITVGGIRADGAQGSFNSYEDHSDEHDNDSRDNSRDFDSDERRFG